MNTMQILMLLKAVAGVAAAVLDWLRDRRMARLVARADEATSLKEISDAIDTAHAARTATDLALDRRPDSLRADDGYRRD